MERFITHIMRFPELSGENWAGSQADLSLRGKERRPTLLLLQLGDWAWMKVRHKWARFCCGLTFLPVPKVGTPNSLSLPLCGAEGERVRLESSQTLQVESGPLLQ